MSNLSTPFDDEDARAATDGQIDADTVDGQDAEDLGASETQEFGRSGGYYASGEGTIEEMIDGLRWDITNNGGGTGEYRLEMFDYDGNLINSWSSTLSPDETWSHEVSFQSQYVGDVEVVDVDSWGYDESIDAHLVEVPTHIHQI